MGDFLVALRVLCLGVFRVFLVFALLRVWYDMWFWVFGGFCGVRVGWWVADLWFLGLRADVSAGLDCVVGFGVCPVGCFGFG